MYEVLIYDVLLSCLPVTIVPALRLYPFVFTHLVTQIVREDPSCFVSYCFRQGVISVGWVNGVFLPDQYCQISSVSFIVTDVSVKPFVVSGSIDGHHSAEKTYGIILTQLCKT